MQRFFYSFDRTSTAFPYPDGWVEVHAADWQQAHKKFRSKFPDKTPGVLNCAFCYSKEEWEKTVANRRRAGNICHRVIR